MSTKNNNTVFADFTPEGEILFMAVNKPMTNNEKDEYVIRLKFDPTDEEAQAFADTMRKYDARKVDTPSNKANGTLTMTFKSAYAPTVVNEEGEDIEPPFFDGRVDTGTARAFITVKKLDKAYQGTTHVTYLNGVAITSLEKGERETDTSTNFNSISDRLKQLSK